MNIEGTLLISCSTFKLNICISFYPLPYLNYKLDASQLSNGQLGLGNQEAMMGIGGRKTFYPML
jgi:hypothetical protein